MYGGPILFFGLAVVGALLGLAFPVSGTIAIAQLAFTALLCCLTTKRIARALAICAAIVVCVAYESSGQRAAFDKQIATLSYEPRVYEGVLADVSDTLSGDRVAILETTTGVNIALRLKDAASSKAMRMGERVRVKGKVTRAQHALSPAQLDGYWFGLSRDIHGRMTIAKPHLIAVLKDDAPLSWMAQFKQMLRDTLTSYLTPREAGLLLTLIVGDVKLFDEEEKMAYRNIGAGHLLAVSGLQVSVLSVMFYRAFLFLFLLVPWVARRSLARYPTLIVTLFLLWGFVALCGSPPSAFRAALMATLVLLASTCAWPTTSLDVFGASGFLSLLLNPAWVVDPSFWLSYSAVFGLIFASQVAKIPDSEIPLLNPEKSNSPWKEKLRAAAITSLGAGLMTLPFSIYYFGELSLSGLVVNIALVPAGGTLDAPAILLSVFGALTGLYFPFFDIAAFFASILESMVMTFDTWVGRVFPVMTIGLLKLVLASITAMLIVASVVPRRRMLKIACAVVGVIVCAAPLNYMDEEALVATFLAVGQGDGAVLEIPPGKIIVIDGGGNYEDKFNPGERVIAPFLHRRGVRVIDALVLSHPDADHIMGLIPLIREFEVRELWHSDFDRSHPLMARLLDAAEERGVRVRSLKELPKSIGDAGFEYFWPTPRGGELDSTNNRSLVLRVAYKGHSILFPGDIEAPLEEALRGQGLRATIVKAPHHGSKGSSTTEFVRATQAKHVVFCTGVNNRFGFPHAQAVQRWQASGAAMWDTAKHGETAFRLASEAVTVIPFVHAPQSP